MTLPPDISSRPASEFPTADIVSGFSLCFEGYIVPVNMTEDALRAMVLRDGIDLESSMAFVGEDGIAAIALVSRRGKVARVSAFGVAPKHRGQGLGKAVMEVVISSCRDHGDETLVLEVIEQNPPALALYNSLGFSRMRRLVGYVLDDTKNRRPPRELSGLEEAPFSLFARKCREEGDGGLPWQVSPDSFDNPSRELKAYTLDGAYCLVGNTSEDSVSLRGLVVDRPERRSGKGSALLDALKVRFPGRKWNISSIVPEDLAPPFFWKNGFVQSEISQQEMRLDLR